MDASLIYWVRSLAVSLSRNKWTTGCYFEDFTSKKRSLEHSCTSPPNGVQIGGFGHFNPQSREIHDLELSVVVFSLKLKSREICYELPLCISQWRARAFHSYLQKKSTRPPAPPWDKHFSRRASTPAKSSMGRNVGRIRSDSTNILGPRWTTRFLLKEEMRKRETAKNWIPHIICASNIKSTRK